MYPPADAERPGSNETVPSGVAREGFAWAARAMKGSRDKRATGKRNIRIVGFNLTRKMGKFKRLEANGSALAPES